MPIYRKGQEEDLGNYRRKRPQVVLGRFRLDIKENLLSQRLEQAQTDVQTLDSTQSSGGVTTPGGI